MFLTKQDLEESLRLIEIYEDISTEEARLKIANNFAREIFTDFESFKEDEKRMALDMILEDMAHDIYNIN